jgi:hypothetical protein
MSVCAKGVGRGVHNIAFSLSPDRFRAFDLLFFWPHPRPGLGILKAIKFLHETTKQKQNKKGGKEVERSQKQRHRWGQVPFRSIPLL